MRLLDEAAQLAGLTQEALLRTILGNASDALIVIDDRQRILVFNKAAEALLGYRENDLLGCSMTVLLPTRFRSHHAGHISDFAADAEARRSIGARSELVALHQNGSELPIEATISKFTIGGQTLFTGLLRDATVRQNHIGRQDSIARRFEAIVQHSADAVWVLRPDGIVAYVSPSTVNLLGYEPESLLKISGDGMVHPDHRGRAQLTFQRVLATPEANAREELLLRHIDGKWRWVDATLKNMMDRPEVGGIVINARDITERKAAELALVRQAGHDALTGLPNRVLLADRLQQALASSDRRGYKAVLLFIDLDRFKVVNDSLGHIAGDQLLVTTASRISAVVRDGDTVARIGGDEFVVLCPGAGGIEEASLTAQRVLEAVEPVVHIGATDTYVTASIGVAIAENPEVGAEHLLADADAAMYEAKRRGGGRFELFNERLRKPAMERVTIESELREALGQGHVVPFYQPIIDLRTGAIVRVEALARWLHLDRGVLGPDVFIPVAEETGLIRDLGSQILNRSCRELLRRNLEPGPAWGVSVNSSVRELEGLGLVNSVATALELSGLPAERLTLEITENLFMADIDSVLPTLTSLRSMGVELSIDDFGVGYSSLSYLRQLPVSSIKIDRSFISSLEEDADARAIVSAVIPMAHSLDLRVVAEGVETPGQATILQELDCDLAQGYLYGKPTPLTDISANALTPSMSST